MSSYGLLLRAEQWGEEEGGNMMMRGVEHQMPDWNLMELKRLEGSLELFSCGAE